MLDYKLFHNVYSYVIKKMNPNNTDFIMSIYWYAHRLRTLYRYEYDIFTFKKVFTYTNKHIIFLPKYKLNKNVKRVLKLKKN